MNQYRLEQYLDAEEFDSWAASGRELTDGFVDEQMAVIEMLSQASLVDGRGVLVRISDDGSMSAELSQDVPKGKIAVRRGW